jgi:outer membrane murein-binding lipoprotein Lpp
VASEKITLIVMHSPSSTPKSISISRRLLIGLLCVAVGLICTSVVLGVRSYSGVVRTARLSQLEKENQALRAEIDQINAKVTQCEREMADHADFEEQMRILADLEPMDADVWKVGVGGPEFGNDGTLAEPVSGSLTSMDEDIDRLLRQIRLQKDSYEEILGRLRERSEELKFVPSIRPVDVGFISSYFGKRKDPFTGKYTRHEGLDFSARKGSNIYATADGTVTAAKYERGYGYTIKIDHGNGISTKYAHTQKMLVKAGQKVERGQVIAYLGNSGRSTAPHVHYEVLVHGVPQNPLKYMLPSDKVVD